MKKTTLLLLSVYLCLTSFGILANQIIHKPLIYQVSEEPVYYRLTLESIFPEKDKAKFDDAFKALYAPFVMEEIDYASKTIVVKLTQKASYDEVKQKFDQAGLRIMNESIIKK